MWHIGDVIKEPSKGLVDVFDVNVTIQESDQSEYTSANLPVLCGPTG